MSDGKYVELQSAQNEMKIESDLLYRDPERGDIVSRAGGVASIYFIDGWRENYRIALKGIMKEYVYHFGDDITHYHKAGSRRLQKFDRGEIMNCFEDVVVENENAEFYCALHHVDRNNEDDPGLWQFMAYGFAKSDTDRRLSGVKIHVPPSTI